MRTMRWPILLVAAVLLFAACGGGEETDDPAEGAEAAASVSESEAPEEAEGDEETGEEPEPGDAIGGGPFVVSSPDFSDGGPIPESFACSPESPVIEWSGAPEEVTSLALLVDDRDADGFVHWSVYGIDPAAGIISTADLGNATEGPSHAGNTYGGPCPPPNGPHHYVFTLFALSEDLTIPPGAAAEDMRGILTSASIDKAVLEGVYENKG